jgi:hypothetical protein
VATVNQPAGDSNNAQMRTAVLNRNKTLHKFNSCTAGDKAIVMFMVYEDCLSTPQCSKQKVEVAQVLTALNRRLAEPI